ACTNRLSAFYLYQDSTASSIECHNLSAVFCQEKHSFRILPFAIRLLRSAGSSATFCKPSLILSIEKGLTVTTASPPTSGIDDTLLVITGVSQYIASSTGIPKPSNTDT